ncbi:MAG: LysR family transcriptional regulator [Cardiobacteriaceae bacterium]|nr:LysR family transcriptional regulator [Cardiobacteriaceae bacterium]
MKAEDMANMEMDWNSLIHFVALVEKQTLTAAAEILGVQHSTVSRQVAQLERHLQLRLFDRIGKRYLLTDDGVRIYQYAKELCKDMKVLQRIAHAQAEMRRQVIVSSTPLVIRQLLMPYLPTFLLEHPHIRLSLRVGPALVNLHERQADIALRMVRPEQQDLVVRRLRAMPFRVYAHRHYVQTYARPDWQFVHLDVNTRHSRWFVDLLDDESRIVLACNDFAAVKQAIVAQIGVGLLPDFFVNVEDDLVQVAVRDTPEVYDSMLYLVMHEDVRQSPSVRTVADFLVEKLAL